MKKPAKKVVKKATTKKVAVKKKTPVKKTVIKKAVTKKEIVKGIELDRENYGRDRKEYIEKMQDNHPIKLVQGYWMKSKDKSRCVICKAVIKIRYKFTLMFVLPENNMMNIKRDPNSILETKSKLVSMFQI